MSHYIQAPNLSIAWLESMEHLAKPAQGGKEANLVVSIAPATGVAEDPEVRRRFDAFLQKHQSPRVRRIRKVADTLFPIDFYHPTLGNKARDHLYKMQRLARRIECRTIPRGTYFDRLIDWDPKGKAPINQLETKIARLKKGWQKEKQVRNGSSYELAFSDVQDEGANGNDELRIQDPTRDNFIMGFPCLSHISLTLFKGRLDLTAVYRNQHFVTKAYGNYVGLTELMHFICREVGCAPGELVCVATHADAEFGDAVPKRDICQLVRECRDAVASPSEQQS